MPPPHRWDEYEALGTMIPDTRFIAFKVPLKEELCRGLQEDKCFSPGHLIQRIEESGKRLGLVVDLTFTYKYYNGQYFVKREIQYEKIFTKGHEVPADDVVQRFNEVVDEFSNRNTDEDVVIGVHCTHGVNRTGYLVCRYMIDRLQMDPDKAIALFGDARGYPIERENYLKDLRGRSLQGSPKASPYQNTETPEEQADTTHAANKRQWTHNQDAFSQNRSEKPQHNLANRKSGRGHSRNQHRVGQEQSSAKARGRGSGRGPDGDVYSSPVGRLDTPSHNGWGNAARSGWGSSATQGEGNEDRGFSGGRGRGRHNRQPRRRFHNQQNYSWRSEESQSNAGSDWNQSYRDRTEDLKDSTHGEPQWGDQAERDRYWRQRNTSEKQSGRGFTGYRWNASSSTQDGRSWGFGGTPRLPSSMLLVALCLLILSFFLFQT